jgi:hypothetical protein
MSPCVKVAIFVVIALVLFRSITNPEQTRQRSALHEFIYKTPMKNLTTFVESLEYCNKHVHWKWCIEIAIPECETTLLAGKAPPEAHIFCQRLLNYCKRYKLVSTTEF